MADINAELAEVKAAISAILGGAQSYTVNGQTVNRASLDSLIKYKETLETRAAMQNHRGGFIKKPVFGA